jgi:hypothetical protein
LVPNAALWTAFSGLDSMKLDSKTAELGAPEGFSGCTNPLLRVCDQTGILLWHKTTALQRRSRPELMNVA